MVASTWWEMFGNGRAACGARIGRETSLTIPTEQTIRAAKILKQGMRSCGSCAAARGATTGTKRAVPFATGFTPSTATTTSVFGWCCVLPTFFCPFFWFRREAGWCAGLTRPVAFRQCGSIRERGFARRGEGRRTAPDRSGPRARRKAGRHRGVAGAGRICKPGQGQAIAPAPAQSLRTDRHGPRPPSFRRTPESSDCHP